MNHLFRILALLGPLLQFAAAFAASAAVDYNRPDTDDSIAIPLYLEPGGFAFAVWPVIFISFSMLGFYQLRKQFSEDPRFIRGRPFIFLTGLGNTIWFYGDVNGILTICTIGFVLMLLSLIQLNNLFSLGKKSSSINERWFINFPISLFFGWITVAFPIGITLWLITDFEITGEAFLSPEIWSASIILAALGLFSTLYVKKRVSSFFVSVGNWGLFWIFAANMGQQPLIAYTALIALVTLVILILRKKLLLDKETLIEAS